MTHGAERPDHTPLAALLSGVPGFARLPQNAMDMLLGRIAVRALKTGEILAREGEPGDALFLVVSGSLRATREPLNGQPPLSLATIHAGQITGELSLLTGHPRAATLAAAEPAIVGVLCKQDLDSLCAQFPEEMTVPLDWMAERLNRYQIENALADSRVLLDLGQEARRDLAACFQTVDLPAGQILFHEGEPGDTLYLILSGRVRIEVNNPNPKSAPEPAPESAQQSTQHSTRHGGSVAPAGRLLAELGKGDLLGEMAVLTGEPRSATAVAVRDTQLAMLDRPSFDRLVAAHPQQMLGLMSRQLAGRVRAQNSGRKTEGRPPIAIAVLPLCRPDQGSGARQFARELAAQLSVFGPTLHLNAAELARILGGDPLRPAPPNGSQTVRDGVQFSAASERRLLAWLGDREISFRHVVYEADQSNTPWTSRCLRQADVLLVAAESAGDPLECAQAFEKLSHGIAPSVSRTLVLLHGEKAGNSPPCKTAAWKRTLGIPMHEHVRFNNPADVGRVARALNRQSVGLVLGGGFALGLAHIGVIDAMRHLHIPIDFVGGTSMGAIVGAACAMEFSHAQMLEVMDKGCVQALKGDYTLPIVSLLTGRKVGLTLGEYLEGLDIEDLGLPYFAISASLTHARMVVHREGSALRSVLASCRAPGMFPPLGWDGDVLVDGGLVNNNPADVMRECVGGGTVFASAVSPSQQFTVGDQFGMDLSGWRLAARKANPFRRGERVGTIGDVLMRMIRLGGVAHDREIQSRADLYLSLPLQNFTFRDFHRGEEMARVGYDFAIETLEAWIAEHGRPWLGQSQKIN